MMCSKCGDSLDYIFEDNLVIKKCPTCGWIERVDKVENININEVNNTSTSNPILRWYCVEYIGGDTELFQASSVYDLIEKILKQEGEFTPFVEKCYQSFSKSLVPEAIEFYNFFSEYTISKISEFEGLNVVYDRGIKNATID